MPPKKKGPAGPKPKLLDKKAAEEEEKARLIKEAKAEEARLEEEMRIKEAQEEEARLEEERRKVEEEQEIRHLTERNAKLQEQIKPLKKTVCGLKGVAGGDISAADGQTIETLNAESQSYQADIDKYKEKAKKLNNIELLDTLIDDLANRKLQMKGLELEKRQLGDVKRAAMKTLHSNDDSPSRQKVFLELKDERRRQNIRLSDAQARKEKLAEQINLIQVKAEDAISKVDDLGLSDIEVPSIINMRKKDEEQIKQIKKLRSQIAAINGSFGTMKTRTNWADRDKDVVLEDMRAEVEKVKAQIATKEQLIVSNKNTEKTPHFVAPLATSPSGEKKKPSPRNLRPPPPPKEEPKPAPPKEEKKKVIKPKPPAKKKEEPRPTPPPGADVKDSKKKQIWDELKEKLPTARTAQAKDKRYKLFSQFDPNGNGFLSLAETDAGCRKELQLEKLTDDLAPILLRAFTAAKDSRKAKGKNKKHGDDFVEKAEFRLLFVYIKRYFELWFMFDEIDTSDDRRVNLDEFKRSLSEIESWGVKIDDPEASFKEIDTNSGGIILFNEFSDWAIAKGLDLEEEESDEDDELPTGGGDAGEDAAEEEAAPESSTKLSAEEAARRKGMWVELKVKLPTARNPEAKGSRNKLFSKFDPNGNGFLSLAETDAGCRKELQLEKLTDDLAPILLRAFTAAKDSRKAKGKNKKHGDDFVEKAEFRLLFVYIKRYFELWFMFDEIDTSDDRRVNLDEFKQSLSEIESWGVKIVDPEASFKEIDTNGGGMILFNEFSEWAIAKGLDLEEEESDEDDERTSAGGPWR